MKDYDFHENGGQMDNSNSITFVVICITIVLILLAISPINCKAESLECEEATAKATWIHWQYVHKEGNTTLTDSYNARDYMRKICNLKKG